jgi:hypothetical protein
MGLGLLSGVVLGILAAKAVNAAGGVHKPLLPCIKGMAVGAYFHVNLLGSGGVSLEPKATGAFDGGLVQLGMHVFFHDEAYLLGN